MTGEDVAGDEHEPRPSLDAPVRVGSFLDGTTEEDLRAQIERLLKAAKAPDRAHFGARRMRKPEECWALRPPYLFCNAGYHYTRWDYPHIEPGVRCPANDVERWQEKLAGLLENYGIEASYQGSVAVALRACWQSWREVAVWRFDEARSIPLDEVMSMMAEQVPILNRRRGFFHGDVGTGKSFAMAFLFFSALEQGLNATWVDDVEFLRLLVSLESFDTQTKYQAQRDWDRLRHSQIIFYNDLGVDRDPPREAKPNRPLLATHLWKLVEETQATVWCSSNLPPSSKKETGGEVEQRSLSTHPDVGPRVVSRILADYVDANKLREARGLAIKQDRAVSRDEWRACTMPALILKFTGHDQRLAAVKMDRADAKKRATRP